MGVLVEIVVLLDTSKNVRVLFDRDKVVMCWELWLEGIVVHQRAHSVSLALLLVCSGLLRFLHLRQDVVLDIRVVSAEGDWSEGFDNGELSSSVLRIHIGQINVNYN